MKSYKGIRYATAGLFEYPVLNDNWKEDYNPEKYGKCCYQERAFYDEKENPKKKFYYNEFRKGLEFEYSNDCQYLNVFTPDDVTEASALPVIVYIHGGEFTGGSSQEKHFDGPVWPDKGVIAVTINYRLGPWGFICLKDLKKEAGHTGNYGLYDQVMALKWVQKYIKEFGGDNHNVTIMGQSAGAMSVQQLCLTKATNGLFNKAVLSSGAGINKVVNVDKTEDDYFDFWQEVMVACDAYSLEDLRNVESKALFDAYTKVKTEKKAGMICFPCIDEKLIFEKKTLKKIPYILGSNSEDIMAPAMHLMAYDLCRRINQNDVYCYFFERALPGDKKGAWHSADLWYWFGTLNNSWRTFENIDYRLSDIMTSYLCNFAKTGTPNEEMLPKWRPTNKNNAEVMCFENKKVEMGRTDKLRLLRSMIIKN